MSTSSVFYLLIALAILTSSGCAVVDPWVAPLVAYVNPNPLLSKDENQVDADAGVLSTVMVTTEEFAERADEHEAKFGDWPEPEEVREYSTSDYRATLKRCGEQLEENARDAGYLTTFVDKAEAYFKQNDVTYIVENHPDYAGQYPDSLLVKASRLEARYAELDRQMVLARVGLIAAWDVARTAECDSALASLAVEAISEQQLQEMPLDNLLALRDALRSTAVLPEDPDGPQDHLTRRLKGWQIRWFAPHDRMLDERSPLSTMQAADAWDERFAEARNAVIGQFSLAESVALERLEPLWQRHKELKEDPRTVAEGGATLRNGPGPDSARLTEVRAGKRVFKLDAQNGWTKIGIEPEVLDYGECRSVEDVDRQFVQGWVPTLSIQLPSDWTYRPRQDRLETSAINDRGVSLCMTHISDKLVVNIESMEMGCYAALLAKVNNEQMIVSWQIDGGQTHTSRWTWFSGVGFGGGSALCMTDPQQSTLIGVAMARGKKIRFTVSGAMGDCSLEFSCMGFQSAADVAFAHWDLDSVGGR